MDKMLVKGGQVLSGEVSASGSKNAALPILFSSLLAEGEHVFHNVPQLKDIESTCTLLESLGCKCLREKPSTLRVTVCTPKTFTAHYDLVRKMRASILCLGPLLARYKQAVVSLPGGCAIGTRPINLHLESLRELGADLQTEKGYVIGKTKGLYGARILFENATVGGTENLLMAAALADGTTVIENAAKEPEVTDLANYLVKMGAQIEGIGTSILKIHGVDQLKPAEHSIIPDRIEAGTLLLAGAITSGEVIVRDCRPDHLDALTSKLNEVGLKIDKDKTTFSVQSNKGFVGTDITTAPYPAFPTDLQAQFMALMTQAEGTSVITEGIFENRFMHVQELVRLNADITPKTRVAVVRGTSGSLKGAPVMATDLRASASLVLAGLIAEGETLVQRIYHLDRGYQHLESKLTSLGAHVQRRG